MVNGEEASVVAIKAKRQTWRGCAEWTDQTRRDRQRAADNGNNQEGILASARSERVDEENKFWRLQEVE